MINPFFKKKGPFTIGKLLELSKIKNFCRNEKTKIFDIKDLILATKKDITFLHSKKYEVFASKTKASFCITTENLANLLPNSCTKIIVSNVLVTTAKITKSLYPDSITDDFDSRVKEINKTNYKKKVKFGKNVLIGVNVKFGKNCLVGHNTIIESNVIIGNNCSIGSNTIIRNTIIKNNVNILDGCIIGKKGFGFFPDKKINFRYPHIGIVIIEDNAEIGCGSTIDRGSLSNTVIGKNTYLDNQVHVAHNNKIGDNCIIAGQVGFAGSSTLGDNVMIGGQAGISGHLQIGNNVQIGGGSGVIKDIPSNSKVMGYPAKNLRNFIKDNK
jgi:UDP-3-O-[3-hydroxymyristoyl] glucosamine N-acyltransferase